MNVSNEMELKLFHLLGGVVVMGPSVVVSLGGHEQWSSGKLTTSLPSNCKGILLSN